MKSLLLAILALSAFAEDAKPKFTNPVISSYSKAVEDIDTEATRKKREARNKAVFALEAEINKATLQ